jgi:hypothetical protein
MTSLSFPKLVRSTMTAPIGCGCDLLRCENETTNDARAAAQAAFVK